MSGDCRAAWLLMSRQWQLCWDFAGIFALRSDCYLRWGTRGCGWGCCWGKAGSVRGSELAPLIGGFRDREAAEHTEVTDLPWILPVEVCSLQETVFRSWLQNWKQNKHFYVLICDCVLSPLIMSVFVLLLQPNYILLSIPKTKCYFYCLIF